MIMNKIQFVKIKFFNTAIYFLIFCMVFTTSACRKKESINELSTEKILKREKDSVQYYLSRSKNLVENKNYVQAQTYLQQFIAKYSTYDEMVEARELLKQISYEIELLRINKLQSLDSLITYVNERDEKFSEAAKKRIDSLLSNSNNLTFLSDAAQSTSLNKAQTAVAKNRISKIKEQQKKESYVRALASNSPEEWKNFLKDYPNDKRRTEIEKKIIDLEVANAFNGEFSEIPKYDKVGNTTTQYSTLYITNKTTYTLTLRYSGSESKKFIFSPGESRDIQLKNGSYQVMATVDAGNVRNFVGTEYLKGKYENVFYIETQYR